MYSAFKSALLHIIKTLQERKGHRTQIVLYHGVAGVGKSTLCSALGYYLGMFFGSYSLVCFVHEEKMDACRVVETLFESEVFKDNPVLLLDQVNTNNINFPRLCTSHGATRNAVILPIIIFTSGHYSPSQLWLSSKVTYCRVIHFEPTWNEIGQMIAIIDKKGLERKIFYDQTQVFGRYFELAYAYSGTHSSVEETFFLNQIKTEISSELCSNHCTCMCFIIAACGRTISGLCVQYDGITKQEKEDGGRQNGCEGA